jgi:2-polyprenyl-6-methoxyphenol hydroxylase-like FAD-dependent oxidoreductase
MFGEFANLPGRPNLAMRRADLKRVLLDRATATGIQVEYGKRLVAAEQAPGGVTARFADGSSVTGDVLIGADGIRSTVRTLIDPNAPQPRYVGLIGFGGFADGEPPAQPQAMHFAFGRKAFFGYWTQPDGRTGWFSSLPHENPLPMAEARQIRPALAPCPDGPGRRRRARAVIQFRPGRIPIRGKRDTARPVSARPSGPRNGLRRLRAASSIAV